MNSRSIGEVFFALCKSIDTPLSLGAFLRFKYGEHRQLAEMSVNPGDYTSSDDFAMSYQVVSLLSKYKGLNTGIDTKQVALDSFITAEAKCKDSNSRIRQWRVTGQVPRLAGIFHSAQRKIARLLGPFSNFCFDGDERWGPHGAFDVKRREAFVDTKMTRLPISVSLRARPFFRRVIERDLHWSAAILGSFPEGPFSLLPSVFCLEDCARIDTVPKSAKTDRVIAVEPRGNGFLQKAVGSYIRKQLRRVGINLNDQGPNQDAAKRGVRDNLVTLDLRAASDTVSLEIVYDLLPLEWADYLNSIRSHYALLGKERLKLEKFSSMGNGFTFELESLIFWALTSSAVETLDPNGEVLVYGDDIVCPCESMGIVTETLEEAGFEINDQKSFGPESVFRESCGRHYFGEFDVTPVYQKEDLTTDDWEVVRLGNRLKRASLLSCRGVALDRRFQAAWLATRRLVPWSHVFEIPLGLDGDDGWCVSGSNSIGVRVCRNRGVQVRVRKQVSATFPGDPLALLAYHLRSLSSSSDGEGDNVSVPTDAFTEATRWVKLPWEHSLSW
jgi:hypothetical protein